MTDHKRSIKNIFVQPKFFLKLSLYYMVSGGLVISGVGIIVLMRLNGIRELMNKPLASLQVQNQINELMLACVQISLAGFGVFLVFSFLFAMIVSHRIAGPQVAIKAYIEQLKEGNYNYRRNLRENDQLVEMMNALKELNETLKEKELEQQKLMSGKE